MSHVQIIENDRYGFSWWHGRFERLLHRWLEEQGMKRGRTQRVQRIMRLLRAALDYICTYHEQMDTRTSGRGWTAISVTVAREYHQTFFDARVRVEVPDYGHFQCLVMRAFPSTLR
jgi:hypothetical protein